MACFNSYLELRQCRPRVEKLKALMSECPFRGLEYEGDFSGEGVESQGMWEGEGTLVDVGEDEGGTRTRKTKRAPKKVRGIGKLSWFVEPLL